MLRIIREEEPSKPEHQGSAAVGRCRPLPPIGRSSRQDSSALVRGELDWIVMKALEKDRGRRYETASNFAEDVQHYLNDEPVQACPPSRRYLFRKFVRRNKPGLSTLAMIVGLLVLGIVGTASQARWAIQERNRAVSAEQQATQNLECATEAEQKAQLEAARAVQEAENAKTQSLI